MTTPPKPKRRWFQFRLRTLMVFVTLCAVVCSWFAVKMQQARRQREAVEAIQNAGGTARYYYEVGPDGLFMDDAEPPGPAWLRDVLGIDFFSDVFNVRFLAQPRRETTASGGMEHMEVMEYLARLTKLRRLFLYDVEVTDAGLENISGLTELRELYLLDIPITDADLTPVAQA